MYFQIEVEHLVEIESVDPGDGHAQRVANEVTNMMVLDEAGVLGKDCALGRFFDIALQRHQSVFARLVKQVVHHFQGVDVGLLAELGAPECSSDSGDNRFDDVQRIRNQDSAHRGAADDDQLRRLHQHLQIAVLHQVAGYHATEDHDDADNGEHFLNSHWLPYDVPLVAARAAWARCSEASSSDFCTRSMSDSMLSPSRAVAWPMEIGSDRLSPHHSIESLATMRRMRSRTDCSASSRQPFRTTRN